jgi:hypothetical protein
MAACLALSFKNQLVLLEVDFTDNPPRLRRVTCLAITRAVINPRADRLTLLMMHLP